jgi:hypothetical protein
MKASHILALLPFKPEDMPKIATSTQEPTRQSLKSYQECIQDQAMAITSTDPTLGFLSLVIPNDSYITLSKNQTSFAPPLDPGPTPPNPDGLMNFQITENVRQYGVARKDHKTFCKFKIILVFKITNSCPNKIPHHAQRLYQQISTLHSPSNPPTPLTGIRYNHVPGPHFKLHRHDSPVEPPHPNPRPLPSTP